MDFSLSFFYNLIGENLTAAGKDGRRPKLSEKALGGCQGKLSEKTLGGCQKKLPEERIG